MLCVALHRTILSSEVPGGAVLVPSSPVSLRRCRELVDTYRDLPMDCADATLVTLAEELDTSRILTTDQRDFSVYPRAGSEPDGIATRYLPWGSKLGQLSPSRT